MLRYLMAFGLLEATKLDMEAADQVRQASLKPLAPPFPYRSIEAKAIQRLRKAFPSDERLQQFAALLGR